MAQRRYGSNAGCCRSSEDARSRTNSSTSTSATTEAQDEKSEAKVRRITAKRLIDWDDLVDAFRWAHDQYEAADELWVTPEVFADRLRHLTPIERALLARITANT